ncbi:MAG: C10 family peptidase [Bacteroidota bacterium]|nr:C10 family peptidase [Bacteroidota bacterium]
MKNLLIYLLTLLIVIPTFAERVDKKTAIKVAKKMLIKNNWVMKGDPNIIPLVKNNDTLIYIVTFSPKGFVIISADNSAPPILGQCENAEYNPEIMPPGLLYLIEKYQYSISEMKENKSLATKKIEAQWNDLLTDSIQLKSYSIGSQLIFTSWAQGNGFNQFCPNGDPAGCTAMAMAQILNYWNCRINPTGSVSYDGIDYAGASANFGETYYNWQNMDPGYSDSDNALLIFHAGVSCQTHYTQGGSSSHLIGPEMVLSKIGELAQALMSSGESHI